MISNGRVRQAAISPTIRQKVWNYIRRNRIFIFGDVMAITGANYKNLREMLKVYEHAGYVVRVKKTRPFTATQYKLIKCTGVKTPTFDKRRSVLFDYNTGEEIEIYYKSALEQVLDCLTVGLVTKHDIQAKTDLTTSTLVKVYQILKDENILQRVLPVRRNRDGYIYYEVDVKKATEKRESFEKERENKRNLIDKTDNKSIKTPSDMLIALLDNMTDEKTTRRALDRKACVREGTAKHYWDRLMARGIVKEIHPVEKKDKGVLYRIYPNKAKALKSKLLKGEKL